MVSSIAEILDVLAFKAKEIGIDLSMNFELFDKIDIIDVCFDKQRLQQVILNLVSNAVKFTSSGGKVNVKTRLIKTVSDLTFQVEEFCKILSGSNGKEYLEI